MFLCPHEALCPLVLQRRKRLVSLSLGTQICSYLCHLLTQTQQNLDHKGKSPTDMDFKPAKTISRSVPLSLLVIQGVL